MTSKRGKFLTFEGVDGAGKSSHIKPLVQRLENAGITVVVSREPGGTAVGEKLREIALHDKMHLESEALIMFASRREHIAQVIEPALARGDWIVSDRFTDSSFAYQVGGRGIPLFKLEALEHWTCGALQPDRTFLFDVPPDVAASRMDGRELDKFEREKADFVVNVRTEYLRRASQYPERFRIIDSTVTLAEVEEAMRLEAEYLLSDFRDIKLRGVEAATRRT